MADNIIALYRPDWELVSEHVGIRNKAELRRLLDELAGKPWVVVEDGFVWIVGGFRHEIGCRPGVNVSPNVNHVAAVVRALANLPSELSLRSKFAAHYGTESPLGTKLSEALAKFVVVTDAEPLPVVSEQGSDTLFGRVSTPTKEGRRQSVSVSGSGSVSGKDCEAANAASRRGKPATPGYQKELAKAFADGYEQCYGKAWRMTGAADGSAFLRLYKLSDGDVRECLSRVALATHMHKHSIAIYPPSPARFASRWNEWTHERCNSLLRARGMPTLPESGRGKTSPSVEQRVRQI
jgi:hypothetical protein